MADNVQKPGIDTSGVQQGISEIKKLFADLMQGYKLLSVVKNHGIELGKKTTATILAENAAGQKQLIVLKGLTDQVLKLDAAGRLRANGGFAKSSSVAQVTSTSIVDPNYSDLYAKQKAIQQNRDYEMEQRFGKEYAAAVKSAQIMQKGYSDQERIMQVAMARQEAIKKVRYEREFQQLLNAEEKKAQLLTVGYSKEHRIMEVALARRASKEREMYAQSEIRMANYERKKAAEMEAGEAKLDRINELHGINRLKQEERMAAKAAQIRAATEQRRDMEMYKQDNAKTGFDKFMNQASAIAAGTLISNAIMGVTSRFHEAIAAATEFEIKVAEIRTLSQDNQQSTEAWSEQIRNLSDTYGLSMKDVSAGFYDILSNQIASGKEVQDFMREAAKFSSATVSSGKDAVNLLGSAIKGFGKDTGQTHQIAASFFKLIDVGRVTASELADTYGTTAPIAHQLGVEMDDLNAVYGAMTQQGVKHNNAATYTRNIFLALLKPTKAMKDLFAEWGVASGSAAVKTFGLLGVMEKLDEVVQRGGLEELAKDLPNIRGLQGGTLLSGPGATILKDAAKQFKESMGQYDNAVRETMENVGKQLTIQKTQIANFFQVEIGKKAVDATVWLSSNIVSLSTIVKTFTTFLLAGGAALAIYQARLLASASAARIFTTAMISTPWGIAAAAIAGVTIALVNYESEADKAKRISNELAETMASNKQRMTDADQKHYAKIREGIKENTQRELQALAEKTAAYNKFASEVENNFKEVNESLKDVTDSYLDRLDAQVKEIAKNIKGLNADIKSSEEMLRKTQNDREYKQFEKTLGGKDATEQTQMLRERAKVLELEIASENAKAATELKAGNREGANEHVNQVNDLRKEQLRLIDEADAKAIGSFKTLEQLKKEELSLAQKLRKEQNDGQKEYQDYLDKEQKLLQDLNRMKRPYSVGKNPALQGSKMAAHDDSYANKVKELKDLREEHAKNQQEQMKEYNDVQEKLRENTKEQQVQKELQAISIQTERESAAILKAMVADNQRINDIRKERIKLDEEERQRLDNLQAQMKTDLSKALKFKVDDKSLAKDSPEELRKKIAEFSKLESRIVGGMGAGTELGDYFQISGALEAKKAILDQHLEVAVMKQKNAKDTKQVQQDELSKTEKLLEIEAERTKLTAERAKVNKDLMENAKAVIGKDGWGTSAITKFEKHEKEGNLEAQAADMAELKAKLLSIQADEAAFAKNGRKLLSDDKSNQLNRAIQLIAIAEQQKLINDYYIKQNDTLIKQNGESAKAIQIVAENMGIQTNQASNLLATMVQLNLATAENIRLSREAAGNVGEKPMAPPGFSRGGLIKYFSRGGAMGTDTIPAMLTPGEFVVNAGASARYRNQLVAINNGMAPKGYSSGGSVQNNSFGNVNVTVSGTDGSDKTVIEIGHALRRAIRRGTVPPLGG